MESDTITLTDLVDDVWTLIVPFLGPRERLGRFGASCRSFHRLAHALPFPVLDIANSPLRGLIAVIDLHIREIRPGTSEFLEQNPPIPLAALVEAHLDLSPFLAKINLDSVQTLIFKTIPLQALTAFSVKFRCVSEIQVRSLVSVPSALGEKPEDSPGLLRFPRLRSLTIVSSQLVLFRIPHETLEELYLSVFRGYSYYNWIEDLITNCPKLRKYQGPVFLPPTATPALEYLSTSLKSNFTYFEGKNVTTLIISGTGATVALPSLVGFPNLRCFSCDHFPEFKPDFFCPTKLSVLRMTSMAQNALIRFNDQDKLEELALETPLSGRAEREELSEEVS